MVVFLVIAGVVWIVVGFAMLAVSKSAIHEILACLEISFGVMFWGFAALLEQLRSMVLSSVTIAQPPVRAPEPEAIENSIAEARSTAPR